MGRPLAYDGARNPIMSEMNPVARFFINRSNVRRSRRLLKTISAGFAPPPSARILELGAGRGGLSALLLDRYHPGRLVVTDFDPRQVDAARTYLTERLGRLPAELELQQADAKALPFEDRSFDCVFAILMLHHVEASHSDTVSGPWRFGRSSACWSMEGRWCTPISLGRRTCVARWRPWDSNSCSRRSAGRTASWRSSGRHREGDSALSGAGRGPTQREGRRLRAR